MCGIPGSVGVGTPANVIGHFPQRQYNFGMVRYAGFSVTQDDYFKERMIHQLGTTTTTTYYSTCALLCTATYFRGFTERPE